MPRFVRTPLSRGPRHERGTMLIIALIVLVAMTLAGIAMMRSVDTATVVAGNIAFKEATVNSADQGIQAAYSWLSANITNPGGILNNDNAAVGYFSSAPASDPDWTNPANWANAFTLNGGVADASGNIVSYIIQRMCTVANCAANATCGTQTNVCASTPSSASISGEGVDQSQPNYFSLPPAIHYRITVRSVGPRNSVTIAQTMVRF